MQTCPLKTAQITPVMAFNPQKRKIYGARPGIPSLLPWTPSYNSATKGMSAFVTKLNRYPQKIA